MSKKKAAKGMTFGTDLVQDMKLGQGPATGQRGGGHRTADQDYVGQLQEITNDANLVRDLRSAEDCDIRMRRILGDCAQRFELSNHQEARRPLGDKFGHADR